MTLKAWILTACSPAWFALHLYIAAEWIGKVNYEQTLFSLYYLAIVISHFITFESSRKPRSSSYGNNLWIDAIGRANKDIVIQSLLLFTIIFVTKDKGISRMFLGQYLVSIWPLLILLHRWLPDGLSRLLFSKDQRFRTIVIGSHRSVSDMRIFLRGLPASGFEVSGLVTLRENPDDQEEPDLTESGPAIPVLGTIDKLDSILKEHPTDQIIILDSERDRSWFRSVLDPCTRHGCHVLIYNYWQDLFDQPVHFAMYGTHTFFSLQDEPLQNPFNRLIKRMLDIAVSLPVVLFVLPPLILMVRWAQKRQAPGPLFYKQPRTGLDKRTFEILKFRSMYASDPDRSTEAVQAKPGDNRVFPFGAFLRRRSLDEFPQFINVLRGEMSVVGPRPHLIEHDELFRNTVSTYRIRHFVKPGITGLAQVNGFRGQTPDDDAIRNRVRYDIKYINSWSIWLDIDIIIRTVSEVFFPSRNAY